MTTGSAFLRTVYSIFRCAIFGFGRQNHLTSFSYGIDTKEPPKIGLYPLTTNTISNATVSASIQSPAVTTIPFTPHTTIQTTLPNFLVPTPTFTTPTYIFNTSVPASVGGIVSSGLATKTYNAILAQAQVTTGFNVSAIPTISPTPSLVTLTLPDGKTTVSTYSMMAVPLGVPPGWSAGVSPSKDLGRTFGLAVVVQLSAAAFWTLFGMW